MDDSFLDGFIEGATVNKNNGKCYLKYGAPGTEICGYADGVFVKFVVENDGSLGDVQILKRIGFGCDEEAQRLIKSMPKWNPGKQNGRNVRVLFTMPISFVLE
jgi:protein TonB